MMKSLYEELGGTYIAYTRGGCWGYVSVYPVRLVTIFKGRRRYDFIFPFMATP